MLEHITQVFKVKLISSNLIAFNKLELIFLSSKVIDSS